jgi:hypothetical protein
VEFLCDISMYICFITRIGSYPLTILTYEVGLPSMNNYNNWRDCGALENIEDFSSKLQ